MIEVLKQALEALYPISHNSTDDYRGQADKAITSLRQAIAELESQEQDWDALAEKQLASIKRDMKATTEDALVRAAHKVMAELESQEQWGVSAVMKAEYVAEQQKKTEELRSMLESQEPVGWIDSKGNMICTKINESCKPLYTTPQQRTWVGLTDEEIEEGIKQSWVTEQAFQSAAWWAEAKLKEKNT
jgi:hypothetical protein